MSETTRALAKHGRVVFPRRSLWQQVQALITRSVTALGDVHMDDLGASAFPLALLFLLLNTAVFVVVLYLTTTATVNKKFLSLSIDTQGATCIEVPQERTGTFSGDLNGYWQTQDGFQFNSSLFQLKFSGHGLNSKQYKEAMRWFDMRLHQFGETAVKQNSLWSLNTWASFTLEHPATKLQLSSNVDAGFVYDSAVSTAVFVNNAGRCDGDFEKNRFNAGSFDSTTRQLIFRQQLTRNGSSIMYESNCRNQLSSNVLNSFVNTLSAFKVGYIEYGFDVRMISLIVGLNTGTLTLDGLTRVENENSRALGLIGYTDLAYVPPLPHPLYCLDKSLALQIWGLVLSPAQIKGPEICFILKSFKTYRLNLLYPYAEKVWSQEFMTPRGQILIPTACSCPKDPFLSDCNVNRLAVTIFYDQRLSLSGMIHLGVKLQQIVVDGLALSNTNALGDHLKDVVGYGWGGGHIWTNFKLISPFSIFNTPLQSWTDESGKFWDFSFAKNRTFRQLLDQTFQTLCSGTCGMFYFNTMSFPNTTTVNVPMNRYDLSLNQLNPNSLQMYYNTRVRSNLTVSMCVDTFSQPKAMAGLARTPPIKLIQSYYECTNTLTAAFMASIGNAVATAGLYVSIFWLILGALLFLFLKFRQTQSGEIALTQENKSTLEDLQAEIRNELIFDTLQVALSQSSQAHSLQLAKLQAFSGLFSASRGEPTADRKQALERCGEEISKRLQKTEEGADANGGVGSSVYFSSAGEPSRRRTITIQLPDNTGRRSSANNFTGIDDRASVNSDMTGGVGGRVGGGALSIARHRLTMSAMSAHPMGMILNQQQPPTRASLALSNIRASSVQGVHQL